MKKILILNGSMRKKTTFAILNKIEALFNDVEFDFVNIADYKIQPCIGCENCLADGIIIGTPVYLRHIPGYLKMLFDRGCAWYHRSPLVGKPIFFVTTTQASGSKKALLIKG